MAFFPRLAASLAPLPADDGPVQSVNTRYISESADTPATGWPSSSGAFDFLRGVFPLAFLLRLPVFPPGPLVLALRTGEQDTLRLRLRPRTLFLGDLILRPRRMSRRSFRLVGTNMLHCFTSKNEIWSGYVRADSPSTISKPSLLTLETLSPAFFDISARCSGYLCRRIYFFHIRAAI